MLLVLLMSNLKANRGKLINLTSQQMGEKLCFTSSRKLMHKTFFWLESHFLRIQKWETTREETRQHCVACSCQNCSEQGCEFDSHPPSPCVCLGSLQVLPPPPTIQRHSVWTPPVTTCNAWCVSNAMVIAFRTHDCVRGVAHASTALKKMRLRTSCCEKTGGLLFSSCTVTTTVQELFSPARKHHRTFC